MKQKTSRLILLFLALVSTIFSVAKVARWYHDDTPKPKTTAVERRRLRLIDPKTVESRKPAAKKILDRSTEDHNFANVHIYVDTSGKRLERARRIADTWGRDAAVSVPVVHNFRLIHAKTGVITFLFDNQNTRQVNKLGLDFPWVEVVNIFRKDSITKNKDFHDVPDSEGHHKLRAMFYNHRFNKLDDPHASEFVCFFPDSVEVIVPNLRRNLMAFQKCQHCIVNSIGGDAGGDSPLERTGDGWCMDQPLVERVGHLLAHNTDEELGWIGEEHHAFHAMLHEKLAFEINYISTGLLSETKIGETSVVSFPADVEAKPRFDVAIEALHKLQHESSGTDPLAIPVGKGGGLGSLIQGSSRSIVEALTNMDEPRALVFAGSLRYYTQNVRCKELGDEGPGCFFANFSDRSPKEPSEGFVAKIDAPSTLRGVLDDLRLSPLMSDADLSLFVDKGPGFWWGTIQAYFIRLNDRMQERLNEVKQAIGYEDGSIRITMHLRYGDQLKFSERSLSDYCTQADLIAKTIIREECGNDAESCTVGVFVVADSEEAHAEVTAWSESKPYIKLVTSPSFRGVRSAEISGGRIQHIHYNDDRLYEYAESRVIDLHLMIGSEYFVGSVMSQTARVVVSVGTFKLVLCHFFSPWYHSSGYARETLKEAIAMDYPVLWRYNSREYNLPKA